MRKFLLTSYGITDSRTSPEKQENALSYLNFGVKYNELNVDSQTVNRFTSLNARQAMPRRGRL